MLNSGSVQLVWKTMQEGEPLYRNVVVPHAVVLEHGI